MNKPYLAIAAVLLPLMGCSDKTEQSITTEQSHSEISKQQTWEDIHQKRTQELSDYLDEHQTAYRWFADFPLGINDGIPFIILKLLPEVAPEQWGSKENFLDVVGLFHDERIPDYPIARGIGWTGLAREVSNQSVDYSSFTCGACHIGRVQTEQGYTYIDGGINSQFNLPQYRVRALNTLVALSQGASDQQEKISKITAAFVAALDKVHAQNPNYFYQNYTLGGKHFDSAYEAQQVSLFKEKASELVANFLQRTELEYKAFAALLDKNYPGFEQPMLTGFGGMADATGISTSYGYIVDRDVNNNPNANPETDLPPSQGITDFMAVWQQGKRKVTWSEDHQQLINGGGQWNGNIPIPMFRNLAAELTIGFGAQTDIRIAAFAERLLENLPSTPYPFEVNLAQAATGKKLYEDNCQTCHKPNNGFVYDNMGTDLGRALVASDVITNNGRNGFTTMCSPEREIELPGIGKVKPCAEFEGVSLIGRKDLAMMSPANHKGYNALPLAGIWAQAPYLHNGAVPTIYHLLVPNKRPSSFIKNRLTYDTTQLGFAWQEGKPSDKYGYQFDTTAISAFSNAGHDKDITIDGKSHKLDWRDNKQGAMDIIEYMKTL